MGAVHGLVTGAGQRRPEAWDPAAHTRAKHKAVGLRTDPEKVFAIPGHHHLGSFTASLCLREGGGGTGCGRVDWQPSRLFVEGGSRSSAAAVGPLPISPNVVGTTKGKRKLTGPWPSSASMCSPLEKFLVLRHAEACRGMLLPAHVGTYASVET